MAGRAVNHTFSVRRREGGKSGNGLTCYDKVHGCQLFPFLSPLFPGPTTTITNLGRFPPFNQPSIPRGEAHLYHHTTSLAPQWHYNHFPAYPCTQTHIPPYGGWRALMVRKWIKGGRETGANRYRSTRTLNFLPLLPLLPAAAVSCLIKLCPRALPPSSYLLSEAASGRS